MLSARSFFVPTLQKRPGVDMKPKPLKRAVYTFRRVWPCSRKVLLSEPQESCF